MKDSGLQIECVDQGWQLSEIPTDPPQKAAFDRVCETLGIGENLLYSVPQNEGVDTADRVELGGDLLARFVKDGF